MADVKFAICDIDGTLARIPDGANKYRRNFLLDEPIWPVINVWNAMVNQYSTTIVPLIFTGRMNATYPEYSNLSTLEVTKQWLKEFGVQHKMVCIRPNADQRKDSEVKREMLDTVIGDPARVAFIFDDRPQVVRMWQSLGIFVFNCYQGDKEF